MNILVVEDDFGMAKFINSLLSDHKIEFAGSIAESILKLKQNAYDVVLLDLNLPNGRGLATIKKLRSHALKIPFVILTGEDCNETEMECFKQGIHDYMRKSELRVGPELARMLYHATLRQKARDEVYSKIDEFQDKIRTTVEAMESSFDA